MDFFYVVFTIFYLLGLNADVAVLTSSFAAKWRFARQAPQCYGTEVFLCKSGECVEKHKLCDTVVDCDDKSDETTTVCRALNRGRCRRGQRRCDYGACISVTQYCDQKQDCWDGSDEADCPFLSSTTELQTSYTTELQTSSTTELQTSSTTELQTTPTKSTEPSTTTEPQSSPASIDTCTVPELNDRVFWSRTAAYLKPGSVIKHEDSVFTSCDPEPYFQINTGKREVHICNRGEWYPSFPACIPCGTSRLGIRKPYIYINGEEALQEHFPWHAGIYFWKNKQWNVICAGTLISLRVVLTAAHCVSYSSKELKIPDTVKPDDLSVSLGKKNCVWLNMEDTEQRFEVKEIVLNPDFRAGAKTRTGDIALLLLDRDAELSDVVTPACFDYRNVHANVFAKDKTLQGHIAGWDIDRDSNVAQCVKQNDNAALLYSSVPVISRQGFYDILLAKNKNLARFVYDDLFVVSNGSDTVLHDFGGGLTISFWGGRHFVVGVYTHKFTFDGNTYGGFINVSHHNLWLRNKTNLWSENLSLLQLPKKT